NNSRNVFLNYHRY
ncbi:hypothetical protein D047_5018, partial [Vibrio parahaemolyticus VPTS-2010_2]